MYLPQTCCGENEMEIQFPTNYNRSGKLMSVGYTYYTPNLQKIWVVTLLPTNKKVNTQQLSTNIIYHLYKTYSGTSLRYTIEIRY